MKTFNIIEQTEDGGANEVENYPTEAKCIERFKELLEPGSLDCYYFDLVSVGGYLRMEDSDGNEIVA